MSLHDGFWQPWEDLEGQLEARLRSRYKDGMRASVKTRQQVARACMALFAKVPGERVAAAEELRRVCARGDLAACFWLDRAAASERDTLVRGALEAARQHLVVSDAEALEIAAALRRQFRSVEFDEWGTAPMQPILVPDRDGPPWKIPVDSIPACIRSAERLKPW